MYIEKFNWTELSKKNIPIIGVDEVGRGCLAGDVYAAAACLSLEKPYQHYTDSKTLSEKRREEWSQQIQADHHVCVGFATVDEIERLNILQASLLAMKRAVLQLQYKEGLLLVDGKIQIPDLPGFKQITLIKGDSRAEPIAAASIVAKVTRDRKITQLAQTYPHYGLDKHKGYATKEHKQAIEKWGPCPIHRKTFAGVKEFLPL